MQDHFLFLRVGSVYDGGSSVARDPGDQLSSTGREEKAAELGHRGDDISGTVELYRILRRAPWQITGGRAYPGGPVRPFRSLSPHVVYIHFILELIVAALLPEYYYQ